MVTAEEAMISRASQGDDNAFEALLAPHLARAHRVAYLITHDGDSAADAIQEALWRAYRSLSNVRPGSPFYPWFSRIVVNEALKQAKRRTRFYQLLVRYFTGEPAPATPELALEAREEHEQIWRAIQRLSPPHRAVIVLRYYEGFSEGEMAGILGIPPGTVKSRLHHARKALGQSVQKPFPSAAVKNCGGEANG